MAGRGDIRVNVRDLGEQLAPETRQRILERMAVEAIGIIQRRTEAGRDAEGQPFRPYSERYGALRAGSGRDSATVSLHLSGGMLASMKVLRSSPEEAVIGFEGSSPVARFARIRTAKGTATSRKTAGGGRATQVLQSSTGRQASNALKAKGHNEGAGHLPRRHFFALAPEDRADLVEAVLPLVKISR
jgi:hypothetical protein